MGYLQQIWDSKWLTNRGHLVKKLEAELNKKLGTPNMLAVSNGTIALQLAIKALEVQGEIITTPFTYIATTSSQIWQNCIPVYVDIDPESLCIDPAKVEAAITEHTTAIMVTHVYGNPCDIEALEAIAKKHNLAVIYDAAHCFGVNYKGQSILNYGDVSTLSFHATKLFHTGEGGSITCREQAIADKCFALHNFGHQGEEEFQSIGINGKVSELHAAMGLAILPHIDKVIAHRKAISGLYKELLRDLDLQYPQLREGTDYNYAYFPVIFPTREQLERTKAQMEANDIYPRRYFYPALNTLEWLPRKQTMPVAEDISERVLCLPLSGTISEADVNRVVEVLKNATIPA